MLLCNTNVWYFTAFRVISMVTLADIFILSKGVGPLFLFLFFTVPLLVSNDKMCFSNTVNHCPPSSLQVYKLLWNVTFNILFSSILTQTQHTTSLNKICSVNDLLIKVIFSINNSVLLCPIAIYDAGSKIQCYISVAQNSFLPLLIIVSAIAEWEMSAFK